VEAGRIEAGRTGEREGTTVEVAGAAREVTGMKATVEKGILFVADVMEVAVVDVMEETDKFHLVDPKPMGKLGISLSVMDQFVLKTKSFYKSFLDGLYAVADLLLDYRPEPKPPDIDIDTVTNLLPPRRLRGGHVIGARVFLTISSPATFTKKWSFDHFIKRRRKKLGNITKSSDIYVYLSQ